jgi:PleD family two-component response regulator
MSRKCFLIDDDHDDQEIFGMAMESISTPLDCVYADDAIQALEILKTDSEFTPDYIFIDFNMPRMNGIQCLQEIRKMTRLAGSRIIMYSTSSEKKLMDRSRESGAHDFIVKPSSIALLTTRLEEVFLEV